MSYKDKSWSEYETSFLKTFGEEVPIFTPSVYREYRGEIFTTFHSEDHPVMQYYINDLHYPVHHVRSSFSHKGVLRGLHYDEKTWKLVQALIGEIYLVVLDVREDSKTYGKWESYLLSEKTRDQVLCPPGFANGHYAITDCIFHYNMFYYDQYNDENKQSVIKWNDSRFNMEWPTEFPILQKRDR